MVYVFPSAQHDYWQRHIWTAKRRKKEIIATDTKLVLVSYLQWWEDVDRMDDRMAPNEQNVWIDILENFEQAKQYRHITIIYYPPPDHSAASQFQFFVSVSAFGPGRPFHSYSISAQSPQFL